MPSTRAEQQQTRNTLHIPWYKRPYGVGKESFGIICLNSDWTWLDEIKLRFLIGLFFTSPVWLLLFVTIFLKLLCYLGVAIPWTPF